MPCCAVMLFHFLHVVVHILLLEFTRENWLNACKNKRGCGKRKREEEWMEIRRERKKLGGMKMGQGDDERVVQLQL